MKVNGKTVEQTSTRKIGFVVLVRFHSRSKRAVVWEAIQNFEDHSAKFVAFVVSE